jgi:hypothetical protein
MNVGFYARYIVQGWMLVCLVFVLPILIDKKETAFNEAIAVICGAFALQGLVHTIAFMVPAVGEFILNTHTDEVRAIAAGSINTFRAYALTGSPFFDLPAAYGVACILFFRLQLVPDQNYLRGWKAFTVMFLMILGISLSGRTGFGGFGFGLLLYLYYSWHNFSQIWKNVVKISGGFLCILVIFYVALTPQQRSGFIDDVFPFAFEAYYNWRDTGKFATASTDALMEVHYYPLEPNTVLWGDAGGLGNSLKYRYTDAGYMNRLMIGGIFYLLILILYQWLYFHQPVKMAQLERSRNGNIHRFCFLLLFANMFLLEYKGAALGAIHTIEVILLYAGISYLDEQYALRDAVIDEVSNEEPQSKPVSV